MGFYADTVKRLGHKPWFASIFKRIAPPIDRLVHKLTGGRRVFTDGVLPTLILVHQGRRSRLEYRTPISYIQVGGGFALAATNWGQSHHPAWSTNLLANPDATVEVNGARIRVRARRVDEREKSELWPRFVDIWPAYDTYVKRSGRNIRVFVLEPKTG
jgi:deazaflavin-dependent oxidoreductase (nitroreductase family)